MAIRIDKSYELRVQSLESPKSLQIEKICYLINMIVSIQFIIRKIAIENLAILPKINVYFWGNTHTFFIRHFSHFLKSFFFGQCSNIPSLHNAKSYFTGSSGSR